MRIRQLTTSSLVLLTVLAVGCASGAPPVSSAFDPLYRFPAEATYVWDTEANVLPDTPSTTQTSIGPLLEQLATEALAAHGYTAARSGTPPFRLSYQVTLHTWIGQEHSTSTASLSLRLSDFQTDRTMWLGFTRIEVDQSRTAEERTALLRETFERMLENFPPGRA